MKPLAALAALTLVIQLQAQALPRTQAFSLPNGLKVFLLEDHERPLIRARLHLLLDRASGALRPGLGPLALRMLEHSDAGNLKAGDFHQLLAGAGIELAPSLRADGLAWDLVARSRDQDLALGMLADRVLRPIFDPSILEAQRLACWREVERAEASPSPLKRHLAPEPNWTLQAPTLDGLAAITYEDLLAFHSRMSRPDRAVLLLHGDLGREQARRLIFQTFGTWTALPAPATSVAPTAPAPGPGPEAEALLALLLHGDPALLPVRFRMEGSGPMATLEVGTSGPAAAASVMLERLQALRRRGFTEADLHRARAAWSAGRALVALHPEALLDQALAEARGSAATPARMEALTVEALNGELQRWLDPARLQPGALPASGR
jgi:hypothetical protein